MRNQNIRNAAADHGVKLWQIAESLGIADTTLSKRLRRELTQPEQQRILEIIDQLAKEDNA